MIALSTDNGSGAFEATLTPTASEYKIQIEGKINVIENSFMKKRLILEKQIYIFKSFLPFLNVLNDTTNFLFHRIP